MEQAALMESRIPNNNLEACKAYQLAAEYYKQNMQTAKAATTYLVGANLIAEENPEEAAKVFLKACDTYGNIEQTRNE